MRLCVKPISFQVGLIPSQCSSCLPVVPLQIGRLVLSLLFPGLHGLWFDLPRRLSFPLLFMFSLGIEIRLLFLKFLYRSQNNPAFRISTDSDERNGYCQATSSKIISTKRVCLLKKKAMLPPLKQVKYFIHWFYGYRHSYAFNI